MNSSPSAIIIGELMQINIFVPVIIEYKRGNRILFIGIGECNFKLMKIRPHLTPYQTTLLEKGGICGILVVESLQN